MVGKSAHAWRRPALNILHCCTLIITICHHSVLNNSMSPTLLSHIIVNSKYRDPWRTPRPEFWLQSRSCACLLFTFTPKSESFLEFRKSTYYPPAPSFSRDMVDIRGGQTNIKERRKLQFKPGEGDALYGVFSWAWDVCLPVEVRAKVSLCSSALYPQLFSRIPCILVQLNLSLHFDSMKIED